MFYVYLAPILIILVLVFERQIKTFLAYVVGIGFAGFMLVVIVRLLPELDASNYKIGFAFGALAGFAAIFAGAGVVIRHALINFYLHRTIQRDRDAAKAGKLW